MAIFTGNTIFDLFDLLPQRSQRQHEHDLFMLDAQMVLAPFQSPAELGFKRLQPVIQPGKIFPNLLEAGRDQLRDHLS